MFDINDALVHQIIRSAHEEKPASRGAFQMASHPLNTRSLPTITIPSPVAVLTTITAGFRADVARLTALAAPQRVAEEACCPAAA
ncbi:MAG TPA: hypothetical protein VGR22_00380 [Thermomicrobiales bacterium]|nr:hypothetical protein [Thermomicrobiales bacterium]